MEKYLDKYDDALNVEEEDQNSIEIQVLTTVLDIWMMIPSKTAIRTTLWRNLKETHGLMPDLFTQII